MKTRISAPAHPSATGGRVSGLVLLGWVGSWMYDDYRLQISALAGIV